MKPMSGYAASGYLYRAVDKAGNTVDFPRRAHRDKAAARRYFKKAIAQNAAPETVTMDKSGANLAALRAINTERETPMKVRQVKYLNNIVDIGPSGHQTPNQTNDGLQGFRCARIILSGVETMHMISKNDMNASHP
jgi:putative transposase